MGRARKSGGAEPRQQSLPTTSDGGGAVSPHLDSGRRLSLDEGLEWALARARGGAGREKVVVHAVAREPDFWSTIERLKEVGASSILVASIEKIIE